jgi:phosphoribosyl 1,2-cyclic phosphodiesterase
MQVLCRNAGGAIMAHDDALSLRFWGVRGSTPTAGPRFAAFGGNTPCVEIRLGNRLFVIDAGSGIAALGASLGEAVPERIDILFSHLHLDHIQGLSFFKPALRLTRELHLHCGNLDGETAEATLERVFSPPVFPVRLSDLPASIVHHGFRAGETLHFPDGVSVRTVPLNHPSGAVGYRFDHRGRAVCYLSDNEHTQPWPAPALVDFVHGADLVVYDAMFSAADYTPCKGWGHSTWEAGIELMRAAGADELAIFHHHPMHDDTALAAVEAQVRAAYPRGFLAREGVTHAYPPRA